MFQAGALFWGFELRLYIAQRVRNLQYRFRVIYIYIHIYIERERESPKLYTSKIRETSRLQLNPEACGAMLQVPLYTVSSKLTGERDRSH